MRPHCSGRSAARRASCRINCSTTRCEALAHSGILTKTCSSSASESSPYPSSDASSRQSAASRSSDSSGGAQRPRRCATIPTPFARWNSTRPTAEARSSAVRTWSTLARRRARRDGGSGDDECNSSMRGRSGSGPAAVASRGRSTQTPAAAPFGSEAARDAPPKIGRATPPSAIAGSYAATSVDEADCSRPELAVASAASGSAHRVPARKSAAASPSFGKPRSTTIVPSSPWKPRRSSKAPTRKLSRAAAAESRSPASAAEDDAASGSSCGYAQCVACARAPSTYASASDLPPRSFPLRKQRRRWCQRPGCSENPPSETRSGAAAPLRRRSPPPNAPPPPPFSFRSQ